MSNMKDLYAKVAGDSALKQKFSQIMAAAEKDGQAATEGKMLAFAKDAGYDINIQEMQIFFRDMSEKQAGELSNAELDMVAGGKSDTGTENVVISVFFWYMCAVASIVEESQVEGACAFSFQ